MMKINRTTKMMSLPKPYVRVEIFALKYNRKTGKTDRLCKIQGIQIKDKSAKDVSSITNYIEKCLRKRG